MHVCHMLYITLILSVLVCAPVFNNSKKKNCNIEIQYF